MVPDEVYVITIVPGRQFTLLAAPISARDIEQQFPHFDVNLNSGEPRGSDSSLVSRATASSSRQPARRTSCCGHPPAWPVASPAQPSLIRKKASLMSPFNSLLRSN
jgi:hypothetical protein